MHQQFWPWLLGKLDYISVTLCGSTLTLGAITHITANEVSTFMVVLVGFSTIVYNTVKTRIEINRERDRKHRADEEAEEDDDN